MARLPLPAISLRKLLTHPRTWALLLILLISIGAGQIASVAAKDRGFTESSLWLLEASEQRVDYYQAWMERTPHPEGKGLLYRDRGFVERSFAPQGAAPPLMPAIVASLHAKSMKKGSMANTARSVNAIIFAAFVFLMGVMGMEAGGPIGAVTAALGAASIPRIFGLATTVGFGISALFFLTLAIYLLHRARKSIVAGGGASLALAAATHTTVLGFFAWFPWLYVSLTRPRRTHAGDGFTATPPVALWPVFAVGTGIALGIYAYPYAWYETKAHLNIWLTHFLRQPAPAFSYAGEVWGPKRIPWHAAPYLLAVTVPVTYLFLAVAGLRLGPKYKWLSDRAPLRWLKRLPFAPDPKIKDEATQAPLLRLAKVCLVLTLALPLIMRSPYFSGLDLIALALPWLLILAAAGMARLVPKLIEILPWGKNSPTEKPSIAIASTHFLVGAAFVALLVLPPILQLTRIHPLEESYYSWIIGGPEGARDRGLPRYPQGPMPLTLLEEARGEVDGPLRVGFLLTNQRHDRLLERAIEQELVRDEVEVHPSVYDADIAVLHHDDLDPGYEEAATDFARTVNDAGDAVVITFEQGAVPIFSVAIVPAR